MGDLFIGETLLGYTILREIGEGGMGKVYLAENQTFGQQVAIKILDPMLARNPELRERFAQEARIQIALQHNNIVRVMNAQSSEELSFLVMEYIDGQSLDQVLKRRGKLSVEESVKIFSQVLDAVGYAHDKGVIHRDLKPNNILVCADGTAKVTDFGIAKVLGDTKLTRTGTSMGSPDYMSPEQVLGKKDIDHRTDIYSLGATLYEMLTGRPPFVIENGGTSDSDFLVKTAHVNESPVPPLSLNSEVPSALSNAVLKSLEKKPEDRFESCSEFLGAILEFQIAPPGFKFRDAEKCSGSGGFLSRHKAKLILILILCIMFFVYKRFGEECSDADQCYEKAEVYREEKDFVNARSMNEKACESGHPAGCFNIGLIHYRGDGVEENKNKARDFFEKSCDAEYSKGCSFLGMMYKNGESEKLDEKLEKKLERLFFEKACVLGDPLGCIYAAGMYTIGEGGDKDLFMARSLFEKSCNSGESGGCFKLAQMVRHGDGGAIDLAKARILFEKSCKLTASGCLEVGFMFALGEGGVIDLFKARERFEDACEAGFAVGCSECARMFDSGYGGAEDDFKARALYGKACELGDGVSCNSLGLMFFYGHGGRKNLSEAYKYYKKACDLGNTLSCAK